MIDFYITDTHAFIWHLEGNPKLSKTAKAIMDNPNNRFILPNYCFGKSD